MKFTAPHWLTALAGGLAAVAAALATQHTFPQYDSLFTVIAGVGAIFAIPTVTSATSGDSK